MSTPRFDLLCEPWVPCRTRDGMAEVLGLRDLLVRSHELVDLAGDPPVTAALVRLAVALVHRVLNGPTTVVAWAAAWEQGRFEARAVDAYLASVGERFDLLHPEWPFFQAPLPDARRKTPAVLDPAAASGNNATLFDHSLDAHPVPLTPAAAARHLLALQAFSAGGLMGGEGAGRVSGKAGPLSGSWVFVVVGTTLFHTLMLNTPLYDPARELPFAPIGEDQAIWERPPPTAAAVRDPAGWLDLLTYPSRRVHLVAEGTKSELCVTGAVLTDGDRPSAAWSPRGRDLALAFRQERTGWAPLRPSEERDLWRDADVLLRAQDASDPPGVVEHVARLVGQGALSPDEPLGLAAYALATNQAKYLYWREQHLPLPARLFAIDTAAERVGRAVGAAEGVGGALQRAVAELAGRPDKPSLDRDERQRRRTWARHAMGDYWARLGPPFDRFLVTLGEPDAAFAEWSVVLEHAARAAWHSWSVAVPHSPAGFRRVAAADYHFSRAVAAARGVNEEAA